MEGTYIQYWECRLSCHHLCLALYKLSEEMPKSPLLQQRSWSTWAAIPTIESLMLCFPMLRRHTSNRITIAFSSPPNGLQKASDIRGKKKGKKKSVPSDRGGSFMYRFSTPTTCAIPTRTQDQSLSVVPMWSFQNPDSRHFIILNTNMCHT